MIACLVAFGKAGDLTAEIHARACA